MLYETESKMISFLFYYRCKSLFTFRFRDNFSFQKLWDIDQNGKHHDWKSVKDYSGRDGV